MTRKPKTVEIKIDDEGQAKPGDRPPSAGERRAAAEESRAADSAVPSAEPDPRKPEEAPAPDAGEVVGVGGVESAAGWPGAAAGEEKRALSYEDVFERLQRLQAEFDNYRRRTDRERLETGAHAQGLLIERFLPVLDDFDRALAATGSSDSAERQGFALIREKLVRAFMEAGLERIPAEGQPFDPTVHEALLTQEVEAERDGMVLNEVRAGYRFKGRVVRPAGVQVGRSAGS